MPGIDAAKSRTLKPHVACSSASHLAMHLSRHVVHVSRMGLSTNSFGWLNFELWKFRIAEFSLAVIYTCTITGVG